MKTNVARKIHTHQGGVAKQINTYQQLRRSVLSCFLWEREFYESSQNISDRITDLAGKVRPQQLAALAIEARTVHNLRHVPLLLLTVLCRTGSGSSLVSDTITRVISRADEITELVALYWKDGRKPLSAQLKKGLAASFAKFDEYQLAKYNRDGAVKLRDVMFMVHPKPSAERERLYKALAEDTLQAPDTWEVALSGGADKKETFTRLLTEGKLGYLALLRNLRNMVESDVPAILVRQAIENRKGAQKVLPFRFVAAARHAPKYEDSLDKAMLASIEALPKLSGKTVVMVDVSGSMNQPLSSRSDLTRMDAAAALGSMVQGEDLEVYTFSNGLVQVPNRKGMAGVDAIRRSQPNHGTYFGQSLKQLHEKTSYDRIIVITDEQVYGRTPDPLQGTKAYFINVASYKNGVGYGPWTHIDGFSENVLKYIYESEKTE